MRLDRLLSNQPQLSRQRAQKLLSEGAIEVNGLIIRDPRHDISPFDLVTLGATCIQQARPAVYLMLNKPAGCVSATRDPRHQTVLDFIQQPFSEELHIAGRLDFNSTGLILLTNDGAWSKRLTLPSSTVGKTYYVTTEQAITPLMQQRFAEGMYFAFENITTQPAQLEITEPFAAHLTIYEGRYHQIKRMFGHFGNKVLSLHRHSIGQLQLDKQLRPGEYRALNCAEIALF